MSFDWQTDETVDWKDQPPIEPQQEDPPPAKRRGLWLLGIFVVFILVGGAIAFRLLGRQVNRASENVESDLLASYMVIERAAMAADGELFATFLSGRDMDWSRDYQQVVESGQYYDRSQFGLSWLAFEDPATAVISTTVTPAFDEAEIVAIRKYSLEIGNGLTQTVPLQHTAVYRLGKDRWLLAPPEDDFWGEMQTKEGYYLTLNYPERDNAIAQRLALELDTKLAEYCSPLNFDCDDGFHVDVNLVPAIDLLNPFEQRIFSDEHGVRLILISPTLVGLPLDEPGFQAVMRGYIGTVISMITWQSLNTDTCCQTGIFAPSVFGYQWARLGLRPYPLRASDWQELADSQIPISAAGQNLGQELQSSLEQQRRLGYALTDFLLNECRVPFKTLVDALSEEEQPFMTWLLNLTDGCYSEAELEDKWQQFLQHKAKSSFPSASTSQSN